MNVQQVLSMLSDSNECEESDSSFESSVDGDRSDEGESDAEESDEQDSEEQESEDSEEQESDEQESEESDEQESDEQDSDEQESDEQENDDSRSTRGALGPRRKRRRCGEVDSDEQNTGSRRQIGAGRGQARAG